MNRRAAARLTLLTLLARLALTWECLWPRLLPLLAMVAVFVSLALLDVLPRLAFWLHVLVLAGFAAAFCAGMVYLWRGHYAASPQAARRRIERDSDIPHRPLTALDDQPLIAAADARGDARGASLAERTLWAAHLTRMRGLLARLRVAAPSPGMARRDPWAVRWAVALVLLIAVAAGSGQAGARLQRALLPASGTVDGSELALDIWITPPNYTQVPPILLQGQAGSEPGAPDQLSIPVGSTVLAQLGGVEGAARLMIGTRPVSFKALDAAVADQARQLEAKIDDDDLAAKTLDVRLAKQVLSSWPVRVVPDRAPEVEFLAPPRNMGKGLLGLQYEARDDYRLMGLELVVRHQQRWSLPAGHDAAAIALPLPNSVGAAAGKGKATRDFSDHPWAGETVEISLRAIDAANQQVETAPITLALPERIFNHPVARALIAARKKLNRPEHSVVPDVVSDLGGIAERPRHFFDDTVVFLALAVARSRLSHDSGASSRADVQRLLWETALRIEDGEFAVAERDLRDIQERLNKALRDGADDAEIERLMNQLQRAMTQYMTALADHLKRKGMSDPQNDPSAQTMESADLQRMLERARELNQAGARDAARKMLSQLEQMLDAIRRGARLAQPPSGTNQGRRMLKGLRELGRRQQQLLDQTFRQQQQGQQEAPQAARKLAPGQSQLRRDLGQLMLQMDNMLGAIPPSVGRAERAMKGAGKALRAGDAKRAGRNQTEALNALRRATDSLAEQLARQRQGQGTMGFGMGQPRGPMGQGRDPFGRRSGNGPNGNIDSGDVKVPTQREILRAREIMQELRRRSGEQSRPRPERDYIDRLIKRF